MPTFTMMIGLPGSGKSTLAQTLCEDTGAKHISSDDIRHEIFGNAEDVDHNGEVFDIMRKRTKDALSSGKSVIYDATNLSQKRRIGLLQELSKIQCRKIVVVMATPYDDCIRRNMSRERHVPIAVIEKMREGFHIPSKYEGWDAVYIDYPYDCVINTRKDFLYDSMDFNQENKNHTATLGQHCYLTKLGVLCYNDHTLEDAAILHDVGKLYTKKFIDESKDPDDAHYYNHNNVGAYESLFYDVEKPLEVAELIQWHMMPYQWEKDNNTKLMEKYKKLWGEELFDRIMKLHEADKNAH